MLHLLDACHPFGMELSGLRQGRVVFEFLQPFLLSFVVDPIGHILNEADILTVGHWHDAGHENNEEEDYSTHFRGFS
jgi:hypothetical protein